MLSLKLVSDITEGAMTESTEDTKMAGVKGRLWHLQQHTAVIGLYKKINMFFVSQNN